jgi:cellulose biosynthesis protein BcsQ
MTAERYIVLGLARARADWFRTVGQWATSASIPVEFAKCVSVAELLARLASRRPCSAVLLDGLLPGIDRDLVDAARRAGAAVMVVGGDRLAESWMALGASAVLPGELRREVLLDALATHAAMVDGVDRRAIERAATDLTIPGSRAKVAAICGPGGTGTSTVAMALARGLAAHPRRGRVVLADLARHAEQGMLHDVRDVAPGVQELIEAHRTGHPGDDAVRSVTFDIVEGGYHLLLGLRRARHWTTVRPRAFEASFEGLCRSFDAVVCDVDADFEGDELGASEIADRTVFARTAVASADVVFAVGRHGVKGMHALARVVRDVTEADVPPERIVPVVVGAGRHPKARASLTSTLVELLGTWLPRPTGPVLLLPLRRVDDAVRDGLGVPAPLPALVTGAFDATFRRLGSRATNPVVPTLVAPGSLGLAGDG